MAEYLCVLVIVSSEQIMESGEEAIIRMKKEGKTLDEICCYIARKVGYDDTVSFHDIVLSVERVLAREVGGINEQKNKTNSAGMQ